MLRRSLIYPAIYKHFKRKDDATDNEYLYAVVGPVHNAGPDPLDEIKNSTDVVGYATNTETGENVCIINHNGTLVTSCDDNVKTYVYYKSMYDDSEYMRPIDMFLGKVDKEKYPKATQVFRFEKLQNTGMTYDKYVVCEETEDEIEKGIMNTLEKLMVAADIGSILNVFLRKHKPSHKNPFTQYLMEKVNESQDRLRKALLDKDVSVQEIEDLTHFANDILEHRTRIDTLYTTIENTVQKNILCYEGFSERPLIVIKTVTKFFDREMNGKTFSINGEPCEFVRMLPVDEYSEPFICEVKYIDKDIRSHISLAVVEKEIFEVLKEEWNYIWK
ncbi:MAG: DUF1653 domain-containing protein [Anaerovoracaceae bacterium]